MKKLSSFIMLVIMLALVSSVPVYAKPSKDIKVVVNDKTIKCNPKPYVQDGEVMIPLRPIAEAVGATVRWDKKTKTAWVDYNMTHVEITIGKKVFYIHHDADFTGIPEEVDSKKLPKFVNSKVVVPAKAFLESLGMSVEYDSNNKVLTITTNQWNNPISYEEISSDLIKSNEKLIKWYNENNSKEGIRYIRDGKHIYVLIAAGEKTTGGYILNIDQVISLTADTVSVTASITPPNENAIMVITYPSKLIRIKSDTIKTVVGEIKQLTKTPSKENWVTMDDTTVTKMELFNLNDAKIRDLTKLEKKYVMKAFNEATIDTNMYVQMIAGNILKVTMKDGDVLTFTSYGSKTNVIVAYEKGSESMSYHIVAPDIAEVLLDN